MSKGDKNKKDLCYMGHEDCYDLHTSERLADEADWETDHQREMQEGVDRFLDLADRDPLGERMRQSREIEREERGE